MRLAQQNGLAQSIGVENPASSAVVRLIEYILPVKNVTCHQGILPELAINSDREVEGMNGRIYRSGDTGQLYISASSDCSVRSCAVGQRTTCTDSIWAELCQNRNLLGLNASREAARKGGQADWSWCVGASRVGAGAGEQVTVKAAKYEPLILNEGTTNCSTTEFLIAARRAG